jgi:hypothetical protein
MLLYHVPKIGANVCVSSVVRFRSRDLSPTRNVERRYKLWATRHRTIEETFCCGLGLYTKSIYRFPVLNISPMNTFEFRIGYKWELMFASVDPFFRNPDISPSPYIFLIVKKTAAMENNALSNVAYSEKFSESCFILL